MQSRAILELWLMQWGLFDVDCLAPIIQRLVAAHHIQDRINFYLYRALRASKWDIHKTMAYIRSEYPDSIRIEFIDRFVGFPALIEPDIDELFRLLEHGKQDEMDAVAKPLWKQFAAPDMQERGKREYGCPRKIS